MFERRSILEPVPIVGQRPHGPPQEVTRLLGMTNDDPAFPVRSVADLPADIDVYRRPVHPVVGATLVTLAVFLVFWLVNRGGPNVG